MQDVVHFWNIFFKNWKKDVIGIFLGFFLTFLIMIMWLFFKSDNVLILPSALMLTIIRNGMYNIVRNLNEFKSTGFLKRLIITPIKYWVFYFSLITFNLIIILVAFLWVFIGAIILFPVQRAMLVHVNWPIIIVAIILAMILSNSMGILLAVSFKSSNWIQIINLLLYFLPLYLLGLSFPLEVIAKYPILMNCTFLIPYRFIFNVIQAGWTGNLDMNYTAIVDGKPQIINLGYSNVWIPILITVILILIIISIILLQLKYNSKNIY